MKSVALFSGSFDPITEGHVDIVRRVSQIFDTVYVTAFPNSEKKSLFTLEERKEIIEAAISDIPNAVADMSDTTVAQYVKDKGISVIIKGIRSPLDCQYETEIAEVNEKLSGVETVMLASRPEHSRISSSIVREMIKYERSISDYVSAGTEKKIREILKNKGVNY